MRRYTPDELNEVLRLHKLWAQDEEGGQRANLRGANLRRADLQGADLRRADLQGANLRCAYLQGAYLRGADGEKMEIAAMRVFTGLYPYQCWAVIAKDGTPWVRMGCLWKSVEEWDRIGIRNSNPGEFPDNGSEGSERRVRAFEFTRAEAIRMAEKVKLAKAS